MNEMTTIRISRKELTEVLQAYHTIRNFLAKIVAPDELYQDKFLKDLQKAQTEIASGQYEEVKTWSDPNIELPSVSTGIEDFSINHDHYLYGTSKIS
ncbi:MAG: hypothetical protein R2941_04585 [Desulfobacterales bacterium]